MITIFAPDGIGEIDTGTDLAGVILDALADGPAGALRDGDVLVVTSKIISKAEGRLVPAEEREARITAATRRTVAARGRTRIVQTEHGLVLAAAGIDNSNVSPDRIVLLPADSDAAAAALRAELRERAGLDVGVIISDTAGRPWREGQVDQAIGAAGVLVADDFAGRRDAYGNDLQITKIANADELAAAAELAMTKLAGRPVAVVRGLAELVGDTAGRAADLVRAPEADLFAYGSRESVLIAVLAAIGAVDHYEELVAVEPNARLDAVLGLAEFDDGTRDFVRRLLSVDLAAIRSPRSPS